MGKGSWLLGRGRVPDGGLSEGEYLWKARERKKQVEKGIWKKESR